MSVGLVAIGDHKKELELQMVVHCSKWVLEADPESFAGATSALKPSFQPDCSTFNCKPCVFKPCPLAGLSLPFLC